MSKIGKKGKIEKILLKIWDPWEYEKDEANRLQFLRFTIPQGAPYMQYLFEHIFPQTLLERIPWQMWAQRTISTQVLAARFQLVIR